LLFKTQNFLVRTKIEQGCSGQKKYYSFKN